MTAPRPPEAIEPEQAAAIFAEFAVAEELALRFPADGCYARTHWMVQLLLDRGLTPSKVWAFAASPSSVAAGPKTLFFCRKFLFTNARFPKTLVV